MNENVLIYRYIFIYLYIDLRRWFNKISIRKNISFFTMISFSVQHTGLFLLFLYLYSLSIYSTLFLYLYSLFFNLLFLYLYYFSVSTLSLCILFLYLYSFSIYTTFFSIYTTLFLYQFYITLYHSLSIFLSLSLSLAVLRKYKFLKDKWLIRYRCIQGGNRILWEIPPPPPTLQAIKMSKICQISHIFANFPLIFQLPIVYPLLRKMLVYNCIASDYWLGKFGLMISSIDTLTWRLFTNYAG